MRFTSPGKIFRGCAATAETVQPFQRAIQRYSVFRDGTMRQHENADESLYTIVNQSATDRTESMKYEIVIKA